MKTIEIQATSRETGRPQIARQLRAEGKVPAVIYNNGAATPIFAPLMEIKNAIYTAETFIVNIHLNGAVVSAIVRESQFDPVTEQLLHVDFLQVSDTKSLVVTLPISLVGTPSGVIKGGKLLTKLRRIKVKGIPSSLPSAVEVNVSGLDLGQTIKVGDVKFENLTVVSSDSSAIASVEIPRALRSARDRGGKS